MRVTGQAVFLDARTFGEKNTTVATFGFEDDFDRREFFVERELIQSLPAAVRTPCKIVIDVNKRYDGKEDMKLVSCTPMK
ncbi:hypothetical protein ABEV00_28430 [Paenibacillus thiaminolyticus]|uniref:hypothetical protein n=1 Tax=Paenibacillus thiaminolyticus TaxID=49283 RepID=UPI003D279064